LLSTLARCGNQRAGWVYSYFAPEPAASQWRNWAAFGEPGPDLIDSRIGQDPMWSAVEALVTGHDGAQDPESLWCLALIAANVVGDGDGANALRDRAADVMFGGPCPEHPTDEDLSILKRRAERRDPTLISMWRYAAACARAGLDDDAQRARERAIAALVDPNEEPVIAAGVPRSSLLQWVMADTSGFAPRLLAVIRTSSGEDDPRAKWMLAKLCELVDGDATATRLREEALTYLLPDEPTLFDGAGRAGLPTPQSSDDGSSRRRADGAVR
jgi:hypothetical protein